MVGGVTPGKGGQNVDGIPVFNTIAEAVDKQGANTAMIFVPPRFAADSILEAEEAGIELIIAITEGIPAHDELRVSDHQEERPLPSDRPELPRDPLTGQGQRRDHPRRVLQGGQRRGRVALRDAHLPGRQRARAAAASATRAIVGIGGDPVPGTDFIDVLGLFQDDPETELIVMCGEIGGDAEEQAADFIGEHVTKPVVGYIAGFTAPPGKQMGHAGAIVSGSHGGAAAKAAALEAKGVQVGRTPTEVAEIAMSDARRSHEQLKDRPMTRPANQSHSPAARRRWTSSTSRV